MKILCTKPLFHPSNSPSFTLFSPYLITSSSLIPNKHTSNVQFLQVCNSIPPFSSTYLFLNNGRNGVSVSAAKKQKKKSTKSLIDFDEFDELDEDDDVEEQGMYIPLSDMKEWLDKKPPGFGQGKEYDTSLEDKLFEELEQSRKAQLININKLKSNPSLPTPKKDHQLNKAPKPVPSGFRVRVGNLPRKKNIHRDLQLVFKGFPAIVNISPAVSGTKKTRDPICKGFAFVDLGSTEAANRFVQTYSGKSITFGKIQKQIICEMIKPVNASKPLQAYTPGQRLPVKDSDLTADADVNGLKLREVTSSSESGGQDQQLLSTTTEVLKEGIARISLSEAHDYENTSLSEAHDDENTTPTMADNTDSLPLKQQEKRVRHNEKQTDLRDQKLLSGIAEGLKESCADISFSETDEDATMPTTNNADSLPLKQKHKRPIPMDEQIGVQDQQLLPAASEVVEESMSHINFSEANDNQNATPTTADITKSLPLKQQPKKQMPKKKQTVKQKLDKSPKLNIPGSAKRLRVKEKAVLAGAFSKYGSKASLTLTKEQ